MLRASYPIPAFAFVIALLLSALSAEAALPPAEGTADPCVKAMFKGDASTYNPNLPGWKTGGQTLATGGRYNPNEYEAALQLGLATRYGCGYGRNAICHAVVQAPNGKAAVVRINDNGPLVGGRVIDLNEKSMQYLSGGSMGRNSGVLKGVTVTLLCGIEGMALGPLEEKDRIAWANRTFDAPPVNPSLYNAAAPVGFSVQNPTPLYGQLPAPAFSAPAPAPASAGVASRYMPQPIPASSLLTASQVDSEQAAEEQIQSKNVSDLLNALAAPTSSADAFSRIPLTLTGRVSTGSVSGLVAGNAPETSSGLPPAPIPPQSTNTFMPGYRSPDLQWSARNATSFFRPFFLEIESMIRSILDLIREL